MMDRSSSLEAFVSAAAAKQPTPGGGSVAALVGALAACMGEMVLNYSVGKKDLAEHAAVNQRHLDELHRARKMLLELVVEDQAVFQAYSDAKKAGQDLTELTNACIRVPQTIGAMALAILEIANAVVATSNKWLLSDLAVCGELAMATIRCAIHNVRVNLPSMEEAVRRQGIEADCEQLLRRGIAQVRPLIEAIHARQS
ncbi:MAG: cyclodeaminase/cyclohydrolase family protein [Tepidisphaeraceae bacterium]